LYAKVDTDDFCQNRPRDRKAQRGHKPAERTLADARRAPHRSEHTSKALEELVKVIASERMVLTELRKYRLALRDALRSAWKQKRPHRSMGLAPTIQRQLTWTSLPETSAILTDLDWR
jgi:hypothetical protein